MASPATPLLLVEIASEPTLIEGGTTPPDEFLTPEFSWVNSGVTDFLVTFTDESTSLGAAIDSWLWDFGDGTTSVLQNPVHTFPLSDRFRVGLLIGTADGAFARISHTVTAFPAGGGGVPTIDIITAEQTPTDPYIGQEINIVLKGTFIDILTLTASPPVGMGQDIDVPLVERGGAPIPGELRTWDGKFTPEPGQDGDWSILAIATNGLGVDTDGPDVVSVDPFFGNPPPVSILSILPVNPETGDNITVRVNTTDTLEPDPIQSVTMSLGPPSSAAAVVTELIENRRYSGVFAFADTEPGVGQLLTITVISSNPDRPPGMAVANITISIDS